MSSAVSVQGVSKQFRLYHERNRYLKATLLRRRRVWYEDFWALRNVELEVPEGTTFGFIGENGSGKSTLLKCVAKILRPDSGTITTKGKLSALLELGAGFHPELSGRENIFLNGSILGLSKRELNRRFDEIVSFAGLERFIDTPVKNYSSGMYVRLGFSVAINVDPDVLLIDEVLAVGDESFQRRCSEKFADLRESGRTLIMVSHALQSVRHLCDQVAWLENGALKQIGKPGDIIDAYVGQENTKIDANKEEAGEEGDLQEHRWGSGEARVHRIELLDARGRSCTSLRTGESITFRFHYRATETVRRPVFGMAIYSLDGVYVTGPNTRDAGLVPDQIDGEGFVDLVVDRFLLLPGGYDVTASIYDFSCLRPIDFFPRAFRFDVKLGSPTEHYGVVSLAGRWQMSKSHTAEIAG